ncbi:MAG: GNAT family N-acetyltransferase [Coprobacillaceae bacterium]
MIIRKEEPKDFDVIYELTKIAFQTAEHSDGDEQDFVVKLREGNTYIPELALLVEENNEIIAHIMLTNFKVGSVKALLLAPLTVKLEYRNKKVGTMLTEEALRLAKEKGYEAVFLVGHEHYYPRFGFKPSVTYGIDNVNDIPSANVMALELQSNILSGVNEKINFM